MIGVMTPFRLQLPDTFEMDFSTAGIGNGIVEEEVFDETTWQVVGFSVVRDGAVPSVGTSLSAEELSACRSTVTESGYRARLSDRMLSDILRCLLSRC